MANELLSPELEQKLEFTVEPADAAAKEAVSALMRSEKEAMDQLYPKEQFKELFQEDPEFRKRLDHVFLFISSANLVMKEAVSPGMEESFVVWAKDQGQPIGVSIIALKEIDDQPVVVSSFVGVKYEYRGKKIAQTLLRHRHAELKRRGITQYHCSVWAGSKAVFAAEQRAGNLRFVEDPNDEKELTVTLL